MCGIAGYFLRDGFEDNPANLVQMIRALRHRGPDDEGFVLINSKSDKMLNCSGAESDTRIRNKFPAIENHSGFMHDLALGHRRYSIIDLSPTGHQPMWDKASEVCLSFNGEIYNYVELHDELEGLGHIFQSQSDTEVLLSAYLQWGTEAFSRLNGPWALALYDSRKQALLLSRDRMGKSPLYYAVKNKRFYWASEIKAILEVCGADAFSVRDQAIDDYVIYGWRDLDGTFWEGIEDFPPASYAWIQPDLSLKIESYWHLPSSRLPTTEISVKEATSKLCELLTDAIRIRLRADVPVAFELSGGMDSSSIVTLSLRNISRKITTYTVKFTEEHSNEEPFARSLAEMYKDKIIYRVIEPGKDDFWHDADEFCWIEEEPFHSPNLHTSQNLRRLIKKAGIKVIITGAAGDEVLAGYPGEYFSPFLRYLLMNGKFRKFFYEIRRNTEFSWKSSILHLVYDYIFSQKAGQIIDRMRQKKNIDGIYVQPSNIAIRTGKSLSFSDCMRDNMTIWMMNYWLRSGNKTTFGIPIEPRSPFLDYRVVEYAFSLPPEYLINDGWHKWILRQIVKDMVSKEVVWRREKMGFPFPLKEWLTHSKCIVYKNLKDVKCPYLNINKLMNSYERINHANPQLLWRLINLGLWWKKIIEGRSIIFETK